MKLNIVYIIFVASIGGVIGGDNPDNGVIVNGKNETDIPSVSTVQPYNISTPTPPLTTTNATTTSSTTTTTLIPPTTNGTTTTLIPPTTTNGTTTTVTPPTTFKPNVTTSTESTTSVPTASPSHKGRKFDGPSFIGGIILAAGIIAICFVSWKFYKARTERNYHTL